MAMPKGLEVGEVSIVSASVRHPFDPPAAERFSSSLSSSRVPSSSERAFHRHTAGTSMRRMCARRPRRVSLICHADSCWILPLRAGTSAASHKVQSRVRHFAGVSLSGSWARIFFACGGLSMHDHSAP